MNTWTARAVIAFTANLAQNLKQEAFKPFRFQKTHQVLCCHDRADLAKAYLGSWLLQKIRNHVLAA